MNERPSYEDLLREWKALRGERGLSVREVACVNAPRTLLVAEMGGAGKPLIALAAGVHGDEPAAPWALLSIVRDGLLDLAYSYRIWPCTNPSGYVAGTRHNAEGADINRSFERGGRTPEARAIITANRDRHFALSLDLHEDFESHGFYCYEPIGPSEKLLSSAVVEAVSGAGFPLQELRSGYDLGYDPEAHASLRLECGRVLYDPVADRKHLSGMPYNVHLSRKGAERVMTFESPRPFAWEERIAMHRVAVVAAIERLSALKATH